MVKREVLRTAFLSLPFMMSATACATIIGFDGVVSGDFTGPESEDGYTYSLFSGALYSNASYGNPGGNMQGRNLQGGGVLTIGRTDGGLFTFDAADVAQFNNNTNAVIAFEGFVGGGSLGTDSFLASTNLGEWTSYNSVSLSGIALDELRITLDAAPSGGQQWWEAVDNLVFSEVPEPATLTLLAFGLVAARRRRAS